MVIDLRLTHLRATNSVEINRSINNITRHCIASTRIFLLIFMTYDRDDAIFEVDAEYISVLLCKRNDRVSLKQALELVERKDFVKNHKVANVLELTQVMSRKKKWYF